MEREDGKGNLRVKRERETGRSVGVRRATADCETRAVFFIMSRCVSAFLCPKLLKWIESDGIMARARIMVYRVKQGRHKDRQEKGMKRDRVRHGKDKGMPGHYYSQEMN